MELSGDLLKSMLSGIKTDASGVAEMRRAPRVSVRYTVKIAPYANGTIGQAVRVWTRDISSGGLGILHSARLEPSSKFIIQLPCERSKPLLLLCTVRNCEQVQGGLYCIGASFAEVAGHSPEVAAARNAALAAAAPATVTPTPTEDPLLTDEVQRISRAILS